MDRGGSKDNGRRSGLFYQTLLLSHRDPRGLPEAVRELLSGSDPEALESVLARLGTRAALPRPLAHPNTKLLPLGIPEIDRMLGGGALEGHVVEVFGPSGSGKTQLVHRAAGMTAARAREGVIFVDTNGSFSARRLDEILSGVTFGTSNVEGPLEKVRVVRTGDVHRVVSSIVEILGRPHEAYDRVSMIVVDSVGALLAPLLGGMAYDAGHEVMFSFAMFLKQVAREHSCVVLVTNHTVGGSSRGSVRGSTRGAYGGYGGRTMMDDVDGASGAFFAEGLAEAGYELRRAALGESWPGQVHIRIQLVVKGGDIGGPDELGEVNTTNETGGGEDSLSRSFEPEPIVTYPSMQRAAVIVQSPLGGWGVPTAGMWAEFRL